jgi:hypothetical protein
VAINTLERNHDREMGVGVGMVQKKCQHKVWVSFMVTLGLAALGAGK